MSKTITYQYLCSRTGIEWRCVERNVYSVIDEPYPPGGMLRVMRNKSGQIIAGPLVSEITSWIETEEK